VQQTTKQPNAETTEKQQRNKTTTNSKAAKQQQHVKTRTLNTKHD
jgi:hypothetical protein